MAILAMSPTGIPVRVHSGLPVESGIGTARMAVRLTGRMPVLRQSREHVTQPGMVLANLAEDGQQLLVDVSPGRRGADIAPRPRAECPPWHLPSPRLPCGCFGAARRYTDSRGAGSRAVRTLSSCARAGGGSRPGRDVGIAKESGL